MWGGGPELSGGPWCGCIIPGPLTGGWGGGGPILIRGGESKGWS